MDRLWATEVFVRVAECGSFSRAAESLDLANATVTTCVRNLERHLGVTLINRDTRRLRLTEEGGIYLTHARELLQAAARAEEEVRTHAGELRGRLHIETTIALGHALLSPRLPEFAKRYPEIAAAVTLSNQPHNLIERDIDVAIRVSHVEDADLVARPLCDIRYVICCAPGLAATLPAHPADLNRRQCIGNLTEQRYSVDPWRLTKGDETLELRPDGALHFNNGADQVMAARAGVGVVHVPDVLANVFLADGSLVQVYPDWGAAMKTLYVVIPKSRVGSAKVKAFTDFLFEVLEAQHRPSKLQMVKVKARGRR
jgi:LysR family transcriptional regulator, regulator for bpeEF and oprC